MGLPGATGRAPAALDGLGRWADFVRDWPGPTAGGRSCGTSGTSPTDRLLERHRGAVPRDLPRRLRGPQTRARPGCGDLRPERVGVPVVMAARAAVVCRQADCEVNALSWHELAGGAMLRAIPEHLLRARRVLVRIRRSWSGCGAARQRVRRPRRCAVPGRAAGLPGVPGARGRRRCRPRLLARSFGRRHVPAAYARRAARRAPQRPRGDWWTTAWSRAASGRAWP